VALAWVVALLVDPTPLPVNPSVLLVGLGLIGAGAVATTGLVVLGARWAARLGWLVCGAGAVVAVIRPIDGFWVAALLITTVGTAGLIGMRGRIRRLPSATGPPDRAVVLPLLLLAAPLAIGLSGAGPVWAALVIGLGAAVVAYAYARVIPGGLLAARIVWPAAALGAAPFLELAGAIVAPALALAVLAVAWHPSVKMAFHPPRKTGSTFPIPPELAPTEVLDAAGIDDRGRRKK
jgi:hypothetical protein